MRPDIVPGCSISTGYSYWGRPSVEELRRDLRDLSTPGLREAWDAGDLSPFDGWNRSPAVR